MIHSLLKLFTGATLFMLWGTVASAADRKPSGSVSYEKKTTLDFEEKSVDGQFLTPEGMAVSAEKRVDFDDLLSPPSNFSKTLKRDAGAVR